MQPTLALALSIQSNSGVYALLLGSGISRAAQIPTGWEVTLDLVRKVAAMEEEPIGSDPAAWYEVRFGEAPDYSRLLQRLARTPAERQSLLRRYFEATPEEREEGVKVPTAAHRAIAELAAKGYVRVILTTNFDRLLEQALEARGIVPTRISTPDEAAGAPPLIHSGVTVVKIHGDYLDTRIKNTPEELSSYEEPLQVLLNRIVDEFGLVVSGWSAKWDPALRQTIERCSSRRYATYWTDVRPPDEDVGKLLAHRGAEFIQVADADAFFTDLSEKVASLSELARPHPLSVAAAVQTVKRYIPEERYDIRLHDLLAEETDRLRESISDSQFPPTTPFGNEELLRRVRRYESLSGTMLGMISTLGYWGEIRHRRLLARTLERVANSSDQWNGNSVWLKLRRYPAMLSAYAAGIGALANERYANLAAVLTGPQIKEIGRDAQPLAVGVHAWSVLDKDVAARLPGMGNRFTPVSLWLEDTLREPLRHLIPDREEYTRLFDRYEYLQALVVADLTRQDWEGRLWAPVGSFGWRWRHAGGEAQQIANEVESAGADWPLLQAGLFGGSLDQFKEVKQKVDEFWTRVAGTWY